MTSILHFLEQTRVPPEPSNLDGSNGASFVTIRSRGWENSVKQNK
jgi:hypothetical protein